jgi:TRAP-type transport system small permease protein
MHEKWTQFFDRVEKIAANFGAVLMSLMAILVTYQVFSRYVLHYSPYWTEEITTNTLMWVSMIGAACGDWTDTHMDLTMLVSHFPEALQVWLRVFSDLLILFFAGYLLVDGTRLVLMTMNGTLSSIPIPVGYTYLIMPITGAMMICFSLCKATNRLMSFYVWKDVASNEGVNVHD